MQPIHNSNSTADKLSLGGGAKSPTNKGGICKPVQSLNMQVADLCTQVSQLSLSCNANGISGQAVQPNACNGCSSPSMPNQAMPSPCMGVEKADRELWNAIKEKISQFPKTLDAFPDTILGNAILGNIGSYLDCLSVVRYVRQTCKRFQNERVLFHSMKGHNELFTQCVRSKQGNTAAYPHFLRDRALCRTVRSLNLSQLTLSTFSVYTLPKHPNLQKLDLSFCNFALPTSQILCGLLPLKELQALSLAGCNTTNSVLPVLAKFPKLERMDISGTIITCSGLQEHLPQFASLRRVYFFLNAFSPEEREALRKNFQKIDFFFEHSENQMKAGIQRLQQPSQNGQKASTSAPGPKREQAKK